MLQTGELLQSFKMIVVDEDLGAIGEEEAKAVRGEERAKHWTAREEVGWGRIRVMDRSACRSKLDEDGGLFSTGEVDEKIGEIVGVGIVGRREITKQGEQRRKFFVRAMDEDEDHRKEEEVAKSRRLREG